MRRRRDDQTFMIFKPQICLSDGKIRKFIAEKLLKCSVAAYWLGLKLDVSACKLYRRHQPISARFRRELEGSLTYATVAGRQKRFPPFPFLPGNGVFFNMTLTTVI